MAGRLYPRLHGDELLTADRNFCSYTAWDGAAASGAALLWRAPTGLRLPVVQVLDDGSYLTVLCKTSVRGARRDRVLAAARAGADLTDINQVPDAFDEGLAVARTARVVEYDIPDRTGNSPASWSCCSPRSPTPPTPPSTSGGVRHEVARDE